MNHANLTVKAESVINQFNEGMLVGKVWKFDVVTAIDCMIEIGNKSRCGMGVMPAGLFGAECDIVFGRAGTI